MTRTNAALRQVVRHPLVILALLVLAAAVISLGAAAGLLWQPARVEAAATEARLDREAAALRELKYRARLAEDYASRTKQVEALEAKLRQTKSEPEFVRDIESLVTRCGASISQFSSHGAEQGAGAKATYFEFFLTGSYASLRNFFGSLPDLNEFVAIERVSLEHNGPGVQAYVVLRRRQAFE